MKKERDDGEKILWFYIQGTGGKADRMIANSLKDKKTMTIAVMVPDLNSLFYGCIDKKNSGMNTYTGATFPLFLLVLNSISTFGIFTR